MIRYPLVAWFLATLTSSCGSADRREVARPISDSARAQAESALRAWVLARRESLTARGLEAPVFLTRPTLVAFHPTPAAQSSLDAALPGLPDTSYASALEMYRAIADSAGFEFEERRSRGLTIVDEANGAMYTLREAQGQVGIVLAAPGQPLRVLLGTRSSDAVSKAIAGYLRVITPPASRKRAA